MTTPAGILYAGTVVHKRLRPEPHALSYRVFSLLLDLDRLDELEQSVRGFSVNRANLASFHDRDHGPGDGRPLAEHVRAIMSEAGVASERLRIMALCYPRVLGYVFNPLTVYYGLDADGRPRCMVWEVNNTFSERKSYVIPVAETGDIGAQRCAKELFVSPFAAGRGRYQFRFTVPDRSLTVGVAFSDEAGPLIKTHFTAAGEPLTTGTLARALVRHPSLTFKVMGAIHLEAAKLWWKGVPIVRRHRSPRYSVSISSSGSQV